MREDGARSVVGLKRMIELFTAGLRARLDSVIEFARVSSYSTGAGVRGTATTDEGESVKIVEPYGLASQPPGASTGLVVAPGADSSERCLIGSVSPAGRPATDPGDAVLWTASGHSVYLDNDGALTITSKDGPVITLAVDGTVTVDGTTVKLGGDGATLGVARLTDTTASDTMMTAWMASVQAAAAASSALFGTPIPVYPADFGVIDSASAVVKSL